GSQAQTSFSYSTTAQPPTPPPGGGGGPTGNGKTISTFAGSATPGSGGDGGLAKQALLAGPSGVVATQDGSVFVSDTLNHRVRRIDASTLKISAFAGTGAQGFGGDGAPAVSAQLDTPCGIAIDHTGVVYIADTNNGRVRIVDATANIGTFAGGGLSTQDGIF